MSNLPGITREDEEKRLREIIGIAEDKLLVTKQDAINLEKELHAMQQEFDEKDKEQQALWHNTDARFRETTQELRRAAQARKKPYFGRIDFYDPQVKKEEAYYIGRSVIAKNPAHPEVIDWRAPIASVYYDSSLGKAAYSVKGEGKFEIDLKRKRTYEIEDDRLKDFYDSDVVANDELLTKYLAKNKRAVLSEIIATIQQEQNEVIRKKPQHNLIIQGAAGSGKTTVAMHRISYILYNYDLEFKPEDFYIIGSNQVLLNYITGVLPELNVYGVQQMTMEQLFVRLLYEDWDPKKYSVKPVIRGVTEPVKGTMEWFRALEAYCHEYEWKVIPRTDVRLEKNHVRLMSGEMIEKLLTQFEKLSRADKISLLTERLLGKLENEICGKYYSYSAEEKKRLRRQYERYFGKREWKGSIYDCYEEFLDLQEAKGIAIKRPEDSFDVYDLAALAYLYKRLKETEIIREAGHVVIDEAQDFGMMAYGAMKYCLSTCTYTIMGDVSQNISLDYGLNDWQELRKLMLPEEFDYFGLLRKSYRNTVEISNYATDILHHGSFQIYPVQPIIRHGEAVKTDACRDEEELCEKTVQQILKWQESGLETIAVICRNQAQADFVSERIGGRIELLPGSGDTMEFGSGVLVLPLEYTKGLEFDAVLIYDASKENYPLNDGYVKRLYVAATRALHELTVLYSGELTELIAVPVPEEKRKQAITEADKPRRKPMPVEEEKTHAEIAKELSTRGEIELKERNYIGPKRIIVNIPKQSQEPERKKKDTSGQMERILRDSDRSETGRIKDRAGTGRISLRETGKAVAGKEISTEVRRKEEANRHIYSGNEMPEDPYKITSYYDEMLGRGAAGKSKTSSRPAPRMLSEFGAMPDQNELKPAGHARIDCSVRLCMKTKYGVDLVSSYGTLRVECLKDNLVRVCFLKGQGAAFPAADKRMAGGSASFRYKESRESVELTLSKLTVVISRKTGEVRFLNPKGTLLLSEKQELPRQIEAKGSWIYFAFDKKEELYAKPVPGREALKIAGAARYISFGAGTDEMPGLHSGKGYELLFPAGRKTLCCNIPMYGPYIYEESPAAEYYFKV